MLHVAPLRALVDDTPGIWVHWLMRDGRTSGACVLRDGDGVRVRWTADPDAGRLVVDGQVIEVVSVPRHFGGQRWFALCPGCGTRRARLHLGADEFRCRGCLRLVYGCTREDKTERGLRRSRKLRARLGAEPGHPLVRPRGMWTSRHLRLVRAVHSTELATFRALHDRLERVERRLGLRP
jgi:hypothetical protein